MAILHRQFISPIWLFNVCQSYTIDPLGFMNEIPSTESSHAGELLGEQTFRSLDQQSLPHEHESIPSV